MRTFSRKLAPALLSALAVIAVSGCASRAGMYGDRMHGMPDDRMGDMSGGMSGGMMHGMSNVMLDGSHEVPPVDTAAAANGTVTVSADKSVSGSFTTRGIDAMAAHIHEGAAGTNGPAIIKLAKTADNRWVVPAGAMLTDAQYASYMAGNLYVNFHSAMHPNGEIRSQLVPK